MEQETAIEKLARMVASGFAEMSHRFDAIDIRFAGVDQKIDGMDGRFSGLEKHVQLLDQKIDRVDAKLDQHRQETKDGFSGIHRVIGSMSHTLADHEERLNALEGE